MTHLTSRTGGIICDAQYRGKVRGVPLIVAVRGGYDGDDRVNHYASVQRHDEVGGVVLEIVLMENGGIAQDWSGVGDEANNWCTIHHDQIGIGCWTFDCKRFNSSNDLVKHT